MENLFQHYYLFAGQSNDGILKLKRKYGDYSRIKTSNKQFSKLVITKTQIVCVERQGMRLLNPFNCSWKGLGQLPNCADAIIVIANPRKQEIEFFVSEGKKSIAMIIFAALDELQDEFVKLRLKSKMFNQTR